MPCIICSKLFTPCPAISRSACATGFANGAAPPGMLKPLRSASAQFGIAPALPAVAAPIIDCANAVKLFALASTRSIVSLCLPAPANMRDHCSKPSCQGIAAGSRPADEPASRVRSCQAFQYWLDSACHWSIHSFFGQSFMIRNPRGRLLRGRFFAAARSVVRGRQRYHDVAEPPAGAAAAPVREPTPNQSHCAAPAPDQHSARSDRSAGVPDALDAFPALPSRRLRRIAGARAIEQSPGPCSRWMCSSCSGRIIRNSRRTAKTVVYERCWFDVMKDRKRVEPLDHRQRRPRQPSADDRRGERRRRGVVAGRQAARVGRGRGRQVADLRALDGIGRIGRDHAPRCSRRAG